MHSLCVGVECLAMKGLTVWELLHHIQVCSLEYTTHAETQSAFLKHELKLGREHLLNNALHHVLKHNLKHVLQQTCAKTQCGAKTGGKAPRANWLHRLLIRRAVGSKAAD